MTEKNRMARIQKCLLAVVAFWLLWLWFANPITAVESERRLHVVYHPPRLSVETQGVSLQEVLRAIGARVGFVVVNIGGSRLTPTVSIQDATLEEVLRHLLRTESYAVVYRAQGRESADTVIDKLFLLGPSTSAEVIPDADGQRHKEQQHEATLWRYRGSLPSPDSFPADPSTTLLSKARRETRDQVINEATTAGGVGELLETHALASLGELSADIPSEASSAPVSQRSIDAAQAPGEDLANIDEILAVTTRLAQRNLRVLLDGLTTATQSLLDAQGIRGR
jgi:hypothetical protein